MARSPNLALTAATRETVTLEIPREHLTIIERPRCVSQRTSERVLGIDKRSFLAMLPAYRDAGGIVMSIGKLRLCELDPLVAWMARRGTEKKSGPAVANDIDDAADAMAAKYGIGVGT